jgi:hypothetical protein
MRITWLFIALLAVNNAAASTGQIRVEVSNAPGEINLDGMPTDQKAPATIEFVSPGEHLVELQYGCLTGSQKVTVSPKKQTTTRLRMKTIKGAGTLRLRGLPPIAQVYVDDAPVSQATKGIGMPCGGHRIRAEAEGFADWEEMVVITTDRWTTTTVHMVEVAIESAARRPPERVHLEVDDDFDEDLDDWEEVEEDDLLARERAIEEREGRLRQKEQAQEKARQAAAAEKRSRAEAERSRAEAERQSRADNARRSRYGDVDSLDGDEPDEEFEEDEEFFDDNFEGAEKEDDLDAPRASSSSGAKPKKRNRNAKKANTATILGLSTAGAGVAGLVYGVIAHNQYKGHQDQWTWIATNSGGPAGQAAIEYSEQSLHPAKKRRNQAFGIGAALLLSGSGLSVYAQLQNSGGPTHQRRQSSDPLDDLDAFGVLFSGQW